MANSGDYGLDSRLYSAIFIDRLQIMSTFSRSSTWKTRRINLQKQSQTAIIHCYLKARVKQ